MKKDILTLIKPILIIIAALLILSNPEDSLIVFATYLAIIFLIYGAISIINHINNRKLPRRFSSGFIEGFGSILFGIILITNPENIIKIIVIFLGILLLLLSFNQIFLITRIKKMGYRSDFMMIIALLIMITGLFFLFNPIESAATITTIIAIWLLISGIIRLMLFIKNR